MIKRVKTVPRVIFEVRPSKLLPGEVSAVALRNLKKGDLIADVAAPEEVVWIHERDFKKLDQITQKKIKHFCIKDEDDEYCVPADLNNMGISWYFNHNCNPNVDYDKHGSFVAARSIKKGEELFLDYGRMSTDPRFNMKCNCGASNCRGKVTGRDWLKPEFRQKHLKAMWPEMREVPKKK